MEFKDINIGDVFVRLYGQRLAYLCIGKSIYVEENEVRYIVHMLNLKYLDIPISTSLDELDDFEKIGHEDLSKAIEIFNDIVKKYVE